MDFQIQTLMKQLLTKYQFFKKLPQIWHIHKNSKFLKYDWNFLDQLLLPYKSYGRDVRNVLLFSFLPVVSR